MVKRGEFRRDLYYRINVFPVYLPSLNERKDDMALLSKTILNRIDDNGKYIVTDLKGNELNYLQRLIKTVNEDKAAALAGISVHSLYRKLQQT